MGGKEAAFFVVQNMPKQLMREFKLYNMVVLFISGASVVNPWLTGDNSGWLYTYLVWSEHWDFPV